MFTLSRWFRRAKVHPIGTPESPGTPGSSGPRNLTNNLRRDLTNAKNNHRKAKNEYDQSRKRFLNLMMRAYNVNGALNRARQAKNSLGRSANSGAHNRARANFNKAQHEASTLRKQMNNARKNHEIKERILENAYNKHMRVGQRAQNFMYGQR